MVVYSDRVHANHSVIIRAENKKDAEIGCLIDYPAFNIISVKREYGVNKLTYNQKKIIGRLFKDFTANRYFTVNVWKPYKTSLNKIAYPVTGEINIYFNESVLLNAINNGYYKKGLTNIRAIPLPKNQ